ncbi:MAG: hypothetical protein WDM77_13490 [Steroidobacteraceae bacterium]
MPRPPWSASRFAEPLFHSKNAKYEKNKQAAYHIMKELLEYNHWDMADQWLTERYIQHNPQADNGRDAVVKFFTQVLKRQPTPIGDKLTTPIVLGGCRRRLRDRDAAADGQGFQGSYQDLYHYLVRHVAFRRRARPTNIGIRRRASTSAPVFGRPRPAPRTATPVPTARSRGRR